MDPLVRLIVDKKRWHGSTADETRQLLCYLPRRNPQRQQPCIPQGHPVSVLSDAVGSTLAQRPCAQEDILADFPDPCGWRSIFRPVFEVTPRKIVRSALSDPPRTADLPSMRWRPLLEMNKFLSPRLGICTWLASFPSSIPHSPMRGLNGLQRILTSAQFPPQPGGFTFVHERIRMTFRGPAAFTGMLHHPNRCFVASCPATKPRTQRPSPGSLSDQGRACDRVVHQGKPPTPSLLTVALRLRSRRSPPAPPSHRPPPAPDKSHWPFAFVVFMDRNCAGTGQRQRLGHAPHLESMGRRRPIPGPLGCVQASAGLRHWAFLSPVTILQRGF